MINSPKTASSLSELENQFDQLMKDQSNFGSVIQKQGDFKERNTEFYYEDKINSIETGSNYFKSTNVQPNQSNELTQDIQLSQQKIRQRNCQISLYDNNNKNEGEIQQSYFSKQKCRFSTESSDLRSTAPNRPECINKLTKYCSNTDSSDKIQPNQPLNTSNNLFRKSIDIYAMLDAIQMMTKKKDSTKKDQITIKNKQKSHKRDFSDISVHKNQQYSRQKQYFVKRNQKSKYLRQKLQLKAALMERLNNIHMFYKIKIQEQVGRRKQNDGIFMDLLQQNDKIHKQRISSMQYDIMNMMPKQSKMRRKQQNLYNMQINVQSEIIEIERIRQQSQYLQNKFQTVSKRMIEKQQMMKFLCDEEKQLRDQLQYKERQNLKLKKWKKEVQLTWTKGTEKIQCIKKMYEKEQEY